MIIVADSHIPYINDYFADQDLRLHPGRKMTAEDVKDADVLLVRSITKVNAALLQNTKVKFVGSITAGSDHLDTHWLDAHNIAWAMASGFNAPPVADYVVSIIAALRRKKILSQAKPRAAVIGAGHVGMQVIERLKLLNFEVLVCDPIRAAREANFVSTSLEAIADVDLISVHVPLTSHSDHPTYHFITDDFLAKQKPGTVFVNTSRGAIVATETLLRFADRHHLCLDVWENEPRIDKTLLQKTLMATPHIAGYSIESKRRGIEMIYRALQEKGLIAPSQSSLTGKPRQVFAFAGKNHHWEDVVLGIFNPLILTAMLREKLLPNADYGNYFDEMRNQFNYRHELNGSVVEAQVCEGEDQRILLGLGLKLVG